MNSDVVDSACAKFAGRLAGRDLKAAVDFAYRTTLARSPSAAELERALKYLDGDPSRLRGLAWLLFNLDEFVFVQ
jgi:hypothetical protein